jgi:enamine deaminase RidA (YjgF/YER057c/UK114 family)
MPKLEVIDPWNFGGRYTFSPAVRKGNLLFISGMTATDNKGNVVGVGDIVAQTRHIFEKMKEVLAAAGGSFDDIVKTVDYITTVEGYKGTADVRREYFKNGFPAATGIVVKELLRPEALIEIDAIAVLDGKS